MQLPRHKSPTKKYLPKHRLEKGFARAFAWAATTIYGLTGDWRSWLPMFTRTSAHLAVISVAIVAIGLSNVEWPAQAASPLTARALAVPARDVEDEQTTANVLVKLNGQNGGTHSTNGIDGSTRVVARLAQPHTIIPERSRLGVITYTVQAGDTVQAIANSFDLQPTTIMWADSAIEDAPDLLRIDQQVTILPIDGVYHTVAADDTLESIAEEYEVKSGAIITCEYNSLPSSVPFFVNPPRTFGMFVKSYFELPGSILSGEKAR